MQKRENKVKDEIFIVGRIREQTKGLYFYPRAIRMFIFNEKEKVLEIGGDNKALIIRRWGTYPSDDTIYEVLSQIEDKNILIKDHIPQTVRYRPAKFFIYYGETI
ncbi:MAG TPA: hypothetical protein HA360_00160 [Nanoarchaeota archaeon]|nr:hypothetical protein [Candidatus Woesearchaeota archaeon]HIH15328.1 hypothetical protein [Nanoarchaeota archaeon]HIH59218.1 hypothetical protein [Nanoarchaeota archaeon]HII13467.1 hypothetical protein [Nanoarchaeota archaeon]HIJ05556.1 hypothetical protein [Nanoarchaeota archaeon]